MSWSRKVGGELERLSPSAALGRLGRIAAGSALASVNQATRAIHLGVRAGARSVANVAKTVDGSLPGDFALRLLKRLAHKVETEPLHRSGTRELLRYRSGENKTIESLLGTSYAS